MVAVIFIFLRSVWATIIRSVTVPLALLGACALMWAAGYSIDNLSLMAFTISVGFVVDDAIVMLENITRHIEDGSFGRSGNELPYDLLANIMGHGLGLGPSALAYCAAEC